MTGAKIVPARHWGQWLAAAVLTVVVLALLYVVVTSRRINWDAIPQYIFDDTIIDGVWLTLVFTILSMVISILAGGVLATMRLSRNAVLTGFASL